MKYFVMSALIGIIGYFGYAGATLEQPHEEQIADSVISRMEAAVDACEGLRISASATGDHWCVDQDGNRIRRALPEQGR